MTLTVYTLFLFKDVEPAANYSKHFPNTTFVAKDNADTTVYEVRGRIENNFKAGNCSQI